MNQSPRSSPPPGRPVSGSVNGATGFPLRQRQPLPPNRFYRRYKVIKQSELKSTQKIGRFEIDTNANYFYNVTGTDQLAADGTFHIWHDGRPIREIATADAVAVVGPHAALFVKVEGTDATHCACC